MTQPHIPAFLHDKETTHNFLHSWYFIGSCNKKRKAFTVSGDIVDKVQSARAEDECPSPEHTMEDNPTPSAHHWVTWFKAQAPVFYPSSRVLGTVSWQGQNLRKWNKGSPVS